MPATAHPRAVAPSRRLHAPYAADSRAPATWAAYRRDWTQWQTWLSHRGVQPDDATPSHVAAWAADLATTYKASTVCRKVASLAAMYRVAGHASPTRSDLVATTLAGIRRTLGTAPRQAAPLTADLLRQVLANLDPTRTADARDGALLLLGFALAARRSELVALDVADVAFCHGGMRVRIRRSKTDQEATGVTVGVPTTTTHASTCPVGWLRKWVTVAAITDGPIFRMVDAHGHVRSRRLTAQSVPRIVKRRCEQVGLDPDRYSAHSLRAGLA